MQSRYQLSVFLFVALMFAGACQNPSSKKVYSAPFATYQHTTVDDSRSIQTTKFKGLEDGADLERLEGIEKVLSATETGRSALQLIDEYRIGLHFELGKGSCFFPERNEIVIDSRFGRFSAALILIHEVTHARFFHEGLTAKAAIHSRQAYVRQKMEEEIDAIVTSIEATIELSEAGVDVVKVRPSLYYPYRQAYGSAVRAAKYDYPGLSDTTLQRIGRAAGRLAVLEAIWAGKVVTSVTQQTYLEYWGSLWDLKQGLSSNPTS